MLRVVFGAGRPVDDDLGNDEIADLDGGSDPARHADDDHVVDVHGVEQPLGCLDRGTCADSGHRRDDFDVPDGSGV